MIAILGTLPFIATLWLVIVIAAAVLDESGAKIAAALKGEHLQEPRVMIERRYRTRKPAQAPRAASAELRAAA
jgi:hypothetical protein